MRDHFPFWRSILTTIVFATVFAVWDWSIVHITTVNFEGAALQARECRVASALAAESFPEFAKINARRVKRGWSPYVIGFSPILYDVTKEGSAKLFSPAIPDYLHAFILLVPPLDCSAEFRAHQIPILPHVLYGPDGEPQSIRVTFSRIVFSPDAREAYVERAWMCGGECGEGFDTVWRLENGLWKIVRKRATWIS